MLWRMYPLFVCPVVPEHGPHMAHSPLDQRGEARDYKQRDRSQPADAGIAGAMAYPAMPIRPMIKDTGCRRRESGKGSLPRGRCRAATPMPNGQLMRKMPMRARADFVRELPETKT